MAPQAPWSPTAHAFAQHQFSHVANFWKQGRQASFRLEALPGGQAELNLTFQLPPSSEVVPPPSCVSPVQPQRPIHPLFPNGSFPQVPCGGDSETKHPSQKKVSSKQRKSYRRSVLHRAALAKHSLPPPKHGSLRQAALACVQRLTTESARKRPLPFSPSTPSPLNQSPLAQRIRLDLQIGEHEIESPERELLRSEQSLEKSPSPNSPPCVKEFPLPAPLVFTPAKKLEATICLNCDAEMMPDHQCEVGGSTSGEELQQLAPLPLCHYCCHRGSDGHPVHFYLQCICSDNECTCFCYCDDEQYQLKKLIFPSGLGNKRAETPETRAHARATALASQWVSDTPCLREDCCVKCEHDTSCQLDFNVLT